jgi:hypothetical protein
LFLSERKKNVSAPKHLGETKVIFILQKHNEPGATPNFPRSQHREECKEKSGGKEWYLNWRNTHERKEIDRSELLLAASNSKNSERASRVAIENCESVNGCPLQSPIVGRSGLIDRRVALRASPIR